MRNEEASAAGRQNVLNKYDHHSSPNISRTCDAPALGEVHTLHAFGEHDLVDGTLRVGRRKEDLGKVRNEEARAAGLKTI
jgi:hypothetical protein